MLSRFWRDGSPQQLLCKIGISSETVKRVDFTRQLQGPACRPTVFLVIYQVMTGIMILRQFFYTRNMPVRPFPALDQAKDQETLLSIFPASGMYYWDMLGNTVARHIIAIVEAGPEITGLLQLEFSKKLSGHPEVYKW